MKTHTLPSFFKLTAVLLLFTVFGFQQANAQLNVINNTGCWVLVGEYYGNGCTPCNNPTGMWISPAFPGTPQIIPIPACITAAIPAPGWQAVKYAVAPLPNPILTGPSSFQNNPFNGPCFLSGANSSCGFNAVTATWTTANTILFQ